MKYLICFLLIAAGCNNNKTKDTPSDTSTQAPNPGPADTIDPTGSEALSRKMNDLRNLVPLTSEQLQALVPMEMTGMRRDSSLLAQSAQGVPFCSANYTDSTEKRMKLNIWDCAGDAGAGLYSVRYINQLNFEESDERGYQKTIDLNGSGAIEQYSKKNDLYSLTYLANDRFLVLLEGEKTGLDMLKQAAATLNLKRNE